MARRERPPLHEPLRAGAEGIAEARGPRKKRGRNKGNGRRSRAPEPNTTDLEMEAARAADPERQTFAEWQAGLTVTERRIDQVVQIMSEGRFVAGSTNRVLAREWNVSLTYAERLCGEASRVVRRMVRESPDFVEECRAEVMLTFRAIRARALVEAGKGSASHLMVALHANRLFGFYVGVEPAKKLETTERKVSPFDGWTREQMLHFARTGQRPIAPPVAAPPLALVASNGVPVNNGSNGHTNGHSNGHVLTVNGHAAEDDDDAGADG